MAAFFMFIKLYWLKLQEFSDFSVALLAFPHSLKEFCCVIQSLLKVRFNLKK